MSCKTLLAHIVAAPRTQKQAAQHSMLLARGYHKSFNPVVMTLDLKLRAVKTPIRNGGNLGFMPDLADF